MSDKEYEPVGMVVLTKPDWYKVQSAINKRSQEYMTLGQSEQSDTLDRIYKIIEQQLDDEEQS